MALAHYQNRIVDSSGNPVAGVPVQVNVEGTGALAALKSDRDGLNAKDNPVTTDSNGEFDFFVVGGAYKLTIDPGGVAKEYRYVPVGLLQESDGALQIPIERVVTESGDITMEETDEAIIVKKATGAATAVQLLTAAGRTKKLTIVDGKGDAATNNITIVPAEGETIFAIVDYQYIIDSNGASITLTPLADGSGWY